MKGFAIRCNEGPSVQKEINRKIQEKEKRRLRVTFVTYFRLRNYSDGAQHSNVDLKA